MEAEENPGKSKKDLINYFDLSGSKHYVTLISDSNTS
jgi:hypothetical protein